MIIYAKHKSPRLSYIVDFIGNEIFSEKPLITTDRNSFEKFAGEKINYSDEPFAETAFFLQPVSILFEEGIRQQAVHCFTLNSYRAFFETSGDFHFDIFAAAFYLLSRYEEYLPHETDQYGRFSHKASVAYKEHFLELPLINIWLHDFKKSLILKFPGLVFRQSSFKFVPTYDIDIAYSYLHKGFKRNAGGFFRSLFKGEWAMAKNRLEVLSGDKKDPFDSYEWLDSLHLYCRTRAYYFFLVAGQQRGYDKNIDPSTKAMQNLIRYHAQGYTVGIHPSWQSGDDPQLLESEINCLHSITDQKISYSRQHYIRMTMPETYRKLLQAGIEKDFSMGYGTANGFRASVASSFYWYDLKNEIQTELLLFPFCFMDANAFYEKQLTAQQAFQELMYYYHVIKKVNGLMVTIWHNQYFGTDPQFTGWKEVYEIFLKEEVYWDM